MNRRQSYENVIKKLLLHFEGLIAFVSRQSKLNPSPLGGGHLGIAADRDPNGEAAAACDSYGERWTGETKEGRGSSRLSHDSRQVDSKQDSNIWERRMLTDLPRVSIWFQLDYHCLMSVKYSSTNLQDRRFPWSGFRIRQPFSEGPTRLRKPPLT